LKSSQEPYQAFAAGNDSVLDSFFTSFPNDDDAQSPNKQPLAFSAAPKPQQTMESDLELSDDENNETIQQKKDEQNQQNEQNEVEEPKQSETVSPMKSPMSNVGNNGVSEISREKIAGNEHTNDYKKNTMNCCLKRLKVIQNTSN